MIHILYENAAWLPPLTRALEAKGVPFTAIFVDGGSFDLHAEPAPGIYVNRMSPSAHTRGHGDGVVFLREYLAHLESRGARVVNGSGPFALEVSKVRQHATLEAMGISTPRTIAVAGTRGLKPAARQMGLPFLTKHNMGGKGLGVQLFRDLAAFDSYVDGEEFEPAFDGVTLLQQYVEPRDGYITRIEIVDGRFLYALRASTAGGFELCPSDACQIQDDAFCPVGDSGKFGVSPLTADDPTVLAYIEYCRIHGIDAAGIEFVEDREGRRYTYDINMNTNYNSEVEAVAGVHGMDAWADLCDRLLREQETERLSG
ncbi:MAG: alpha-L-glutamate ligase [Pseudomonadota bacterium]|nr:alpha-L-glutamate ligase [Pseudomonadota bacterium]